MPTKAQSGAAGSTPSPASSTSRQGPSAEVRDALTDLAARAQVISHEANAKVTAAMRDALNTASGVAGFAVESARDLVQYLVRRGQISAEEGDRLVREAESAHAKRSGKKGAKAASKRLPVAKAAPKKPKVKAKKR